MAPRLKHLDPIPDTEMRALGFIPVGAMWGYPEPVTAPSIIIYVRWLSELAVYSCDMYTYQKDWAGLLTPQELRAAIAAHKLTGVFDPPVGVHP